jgi:hypothetical protein
MKTGRTAFAEGGAPNRIAAISTAQEAALTTTCPMTSALDAPPANQRTARIRHSRMSAALGRKPAVERD